MKIYELLIAMVKAVAALAKKVQRYDADLARQMKRASCSVVLNAVEGWHSYSGNRVVRFHSAMASARETVACLDISVACGYLREAEVSVELDRLDHIVAVMWRLSKTRK